MRRSAPAQQQALTRGWLCGHNEYVAILDSTICPAVETLGEVPAGWVIIEVMPGEHGTNAFCPDHVQWARAMAALL